MKLRKYKIGNRTVYNIALENRKGNELVYSYMAHKHDNRFTIAQNLRRMRSELRNFDHERR